jgi:hypothetical protein
VAYRLERFTRRLQNLTLESRETDNTGGFTALVTSIGVKKPFGNSKAKRRTHEAKINMSFVNLLYTICLLLPTELRWYSIQHHLNLHIGEAEYKTIVDGGLVDPDGEMHVLLEVKAFAQNGLHCSAREGKPFFAKAMVKRVMQNDVPNGYVATGWTTEKQLSYGLTHPLVTVSQYGHMLVTLPLLCIDAGSIFSLRLVLFDSSLVSIMHVYLFPQYYTLLYACQKLVSQNLRRERKKH